MGNKIIKERRKDIGGIGVEVLNERLGNLDSNYCDFKEEIQKELKKIGGSLSSLVESKQEINKAVLFLEDHKDGIVWAKDVKRQTEKVKITVIGMIFVSFIGWVAVTIYTPITEWWTR